MRSSLLLDYKIEFGETIRYEAEEQGKRWLLEASEAMILYLDFTL